MPWWNGPRGFQKLERPAKVRVKERARIGNRCPHPRRGSKVDNQFWPIRRHEIAKDPGRFDGLGDVGIVRLPGQARQADMRYLWVVSRRKRVDSHDVPTGRQEAKRHVHSDEAC